MTAQRARLLRNIALGLAISLVVAIGHRDGWFVRPNRWAYDFRARHFQLKNRPPTDRIVQLDINDESLKAIGDWPWPRLVMAEIVDEIHNAGAKALALDIILHESESSIFRNALPTTSPADVDNLSSAPSASDIKLADAIKRFGNVVVPISFIYRTEGSASINKTAIEELLQKNVEASQEEVATALRQVGIVTISSDEFLKARDHVLRMRIADESKNGTLTYGQLRDRIIPKAAARFGDASPLARALQLQVENYESSILASRFSPVSTQPGLLTAEDAIVTMPILASNAGRTGFVDVQKLSDGVVRSIPLFVNDEHGRMVPQLGFALACAYMDLDAKDVTIDFDTVVVHRSGKPPLRIRTRPLRTAANGVAGLFIDIPLEGTSDSFTMYDYPRHQLPRQHVPVVKVWDIIKTRDRIRRNNMAIDKALAFILEMTGDKSRSGDFVRNPPPTDDTAGRLDAARLLLNDDYVKQNFIDYYANMPAQDSAKLTQQDRDIRLGVKDLQNYLSQTPQLIDQLKSAQSDLAQEMAGRAVILGWTGTGNTDFVSTCLGPSFPGCVLHGAVFNAVLTSRNWWNVPDWVEFWTTLLMGVIATLIVAGLSAWKSTLATLVLIAGFLAIDFLALFDRNEILLSAASPVIAAGLAWAGVTLMRFINETTERNRLTKRFRAYTDPALVNWVVEHPEQARFDGESRETTSVFTDLAGFTTLAEKLKGEAIPLLKEYLKQMVPAIRTHGGFIARFMGDGIFFFFGAPQHVDDHAFRAARAINDMMIAMSKLNASFTNRNLPTLKMRIGVGTGEVVIGDTGTDDRCEYTALGDPVNYASRLESANKEFGTKNLISFRTMQLLCPDGDLLKGEFMIRPVALLQVVGKRESEMTYELLGPAKDAPPAWADMVSRSMRIVAGFEKSQFQECLDEVTQYEQLYDAREWTKHYKSLSTAYLSNPPGDFDGVIKLEHK